MPRKHKHSLTDTPVTGTGASWRRKGQMFGDCRRGDPERWVLTDGEGGVPLTLLGSAPAALEGEGRGGCCGRWSTSLRDGFGPKLAKVFQGGDGTQ